MPTGEAKSRRAMLGWVAAGAASAHSAQAEEPANRLYVNRYDVTLPVRGNGFRARLGTVGGRMIEVELPFPDASDHFLKLAQLASGQRARLVVDLEKDGRTVRSVGLETT